MNRPTSCKARQHSDQMSCACGLAWDMNDPDPPECRKVVVAKQELSAMRHIISEPTRWAVKKNGLVALQEMPLHHLPTYGIKSGLYQVEWASLPDVVFVLIETPVRDEPNEQSREYRFFDKKGQQHLEIRRADGGEGPRFQYRFNDGQWATE